MSGGRFLVSLREANNSAKSLALSNILKENINFWEEDIYMEDQTPSIISKLQHEMEILSTEIHESELSEDTKQVAVSVAGYIAKSLAKKSACDECRLKLVAQQRDIDHDDYLKLLSFSIF